MADPERPADASSTPEDKGDTAREEAAPPADPERRTFLGTASSLAMVGGLIAGYGSFAAIAGQFLYPARPPGRTWLFVAELSRFPPGESLAYKAPDGRAIVIARRGDTGAAEDFVALSSTCPHLGCQVHWEQPNNRFFCPCHNGTFDPQGRGTGGPPGKAGQSLGRFPLKVEDGLLFIEVPL